MRFVAVREAADEFIRTGQLTGAAAFLLGGVLIAPAEIFKDRAGKQHVFLQNDGNRIAQRFQIIFAYIVAADEHLALGGVVQTGDQAGQSGLRAARAAQDSDRLPGLHTQVDVLQNRLAASLFAVGEGNVAEFNAAVRDVRPRIFRAGQVGLFI